jgi:glycine cleavage system H lipoate-binding protein
MLFYFPERMYTDKHEWILIDGKTGTVGISHYAQVNILMGQF